MPHSTKITAQPVIIIGAGRSGTNMLRDVLCQLDGFSTWPCDEINYIWRYGNRSFPTDELITSMAFPASVLYIRRSFNAMSLRNTSNCNNRRPTFLVEKTCANSLRVPFVNAVIPEAKYIYLIRDGRDVVSSAKKRWSASLDIGYLSRKARYVPLSDIPYYSSRYFINRITKLTSQDSVLSTWGPKFEGMAEMLGQESVEYICAAQWARCVELADRGFEAIDTNKVIKVRYEDFVIDPVGGLEKIGDFLSIEQSRADYKNASESVKENISGGNFRSHVSCQSSIHSILLAGLTEHGYL